MNIKSAIPICLTNSILSFVSSVIIYLWFLPIKILVITSILMVCFCVALWVYNLAVEQLYTGLDTVLTKYTYYIGFYLFLFIELMFFFSFFWAYFSISVDMYPATGFSWPPLYLESAYSTHVDLVSILNILLIGSSLLVSMYYIFISSFYKLYALLSLIVLSGVIFSYLQYVEYTDSYLNIANTAYASLLYTITGLHTIHVLIGIILFIFFLYRLSINQFILEHTFNLVVAVYYWHFVDVIWIFVYITQFINADFLTTSYFYLVDILYADSNYADYDYEDVIFHSVSLFSFECEPLYIDMFDADYVDPFGELDIY